MAAEAVPPDDADDVEPAQGPTPPGRRAFTREEVTDLLFAARESMVARLSRIDGVSRDDAEDLFSDAAFVLTLRAETFADNVHLMSAMNAGLTFRTKWMFRDRRRHAVPTDTHALVEAADSKLAVEDRALLRLEAETELLIMRDFLAAMTPAEAAVAKMIRGQELSVVQTAKRLGLSRHAVDELRKSAQRKLDTFARLYTAGEWCGRRQADIDRLDITQDEGTHRRAHAHLQACPVCRSAYQRHVDQVGRTVGAVLPVPALAAAGQHGGYLDRLLELLPGISPSGRTEAVVGTIAAAGTGGAATVAKVTAVVATSAAVAGGGVVAVTELDKPAPKPKAAAAAPARTTPAPPAPSASAATAAQRTARTASVRSAATTTVTAKTAAKPKQPTRTPSTTRKTADRQRDVQELGTAQQVPVTSGAATQASTNRSAPTAGAANAPTAGSSLGAQRGSGGNGAGQEDFLP